MSCSYRTDARFGGHFLRHFAWLLGCCCGVAHAEWQPYVHVEAFGRSEPIAIINAIHDWKGEFGRGETQYLQSWLEAGVRSDRWALGLLHRRDYAMWFTPDTAEFYGSVQNEQPLEPGREYGLWLDASAVVAEGVRLAWLPDRHGDLQLEFGLSLLKARYLIDGSIKGSAMATAEKAYSYNAWVDYRYTKDVLFEREVEQTYGFGVSLDANLDWQVSPAWRVNLQGWDLLGAIWWQDLPYTRAQAYSDRTSTKASGYTEWAPLVSGTESHQPHYRQSLSPKLAADLYYRLPARNRALSVAVGGRYQFDDTLVRAGIGYRAGEWELFAWWWLEDNGVELSADWRKLRLRLGGDALKFDKARLLTLTLAYNY